ncbi:MAG: mannose-1-phosphate guanylyltransferase [Candidatus Cloacimonetes bacterium]|nr:mannose-1-phosphate guanylyltransferase [Candidatus Cloacimonadota bacterium]
MIALIMAGGSGTRFWPLSRKANPKQFLKLFDDKSMIRLTYERVLPFIKPEDIYVVTVQEQVTLLNQHIPELPPSQIIIEPCGMNTAPCIALSAVFLSERYDSDTPMLVLPADHYIGDIAAFGKAMKAALASAHSQKLITFGIKPTFPATGYGYIEAGEEILPAMFHVKHFREKPNQEIAQEFLKNNNYFWNSGMFCWTIDAILESFNEFEPKILEIISKMNTCLSVRERNEVYSTQKKLPIDIAILEKSKNVVVFPVEFKWSDVGNWMSLSEHLPRKEYDNYFAEFGYVVDSKGNTVFSGKFVALIGIDDIIVVETADAILVIDKTKAEIVKDLTDYITINKPDLL